MNSVNMWLKFFSLGYRGEKSVIFQRVYVVVSKYFEVIFQIHSTWRISTVVPSSLLDYLELL